MSAKQARAVETAVRALATVGLAAGLRLSIDEMREWSSREKEAGGGGYFPRRICLAQRARPSAAVSEGDR